MLVKLLAPVVQKVDNTIHRINHYPLDIAIGLAITNIQWIAIYPVDSAIHRLNNWGLMNLLTINVTKQQNIGQIFRKRFCLQLI